MLLAEIMGNERYAAKCFEDKALDQVQIHRVARAHEMRNLMDADKLHADLAELKMRRVAPYKKELLERFVADTSTADVVFPSVICSRTMSTTTSTTRPTTSRKRRSEEERAEFMLKCGAGGVFLPVIANQPRGRKCLRRTLQRGWRPWIGSDGN